MAKHRFVSVTYGEFQSFYLYGRLTVPSARVAEFSTRRDGSPSKGRRAEKGMERLLLGIPQLTLEDQEGVVILELAPRTRAGGKSGLKKLSIDDLRGVTPTTARARRILEPRMRAFGVKLAEPHFERRFVDGWSERGVANAVDGGRALCELLFEEEEVQIGARLEAAAQEAIRALDNPAAGKESRSATWVLGAFRFTRHDPYDHGNVNYLIDAGRVVNPEPPTDATPPEAPRPQVLSIDPDLVECFRAVVRDMIERQTRRALTLAEILRSEEFEAAARRFEGMAEFPAGLDRLVLFCRWKERFHAWREEIDAEALTALADDARELLDRGVVFEAVAESLWLLGCFAGHERVARLRYAAARPPWYSGPSLELTKIPRRAKPSAPSGPEAETTADGRAPVAAAGSPGRVETAVDGDLPLMLTDDARGGDRLDRQVVSDGEAAGGSGAAAPVVSGANQKPDEPS